MLLQNFWLQQHVAALFKDENYGHNQGLSWTETSKKTFQQLARRIQYDPKIVFNVSVSRMLRSTCAAPMLPEQTVPDEATWFASGVSYVLFGAGGACKRFLSLCTSFVEDYWEGEMRLFARNAAPGSDMTCMAIVGTDEVGGQFASCRAEFMCLWLLPVMRRHNRRGPLGDRPAAEGTGSRVRAADAKPVRVLPRRSRSAF